jgi:hypothetical protein
LVSNQIYSCAVCGGFSGSSSDKAEAFVLKREVPGFGSIESGTIQTASLNGRCESRMVSRAHFFTEFHFHLVDLTFVLKVHKGVCADGFEGHR